MLRCFAVLIVQGILVAQVGTGKVLQPQARLATSYQ